MNGRGYTREEKAVMEEYLDIVEKTYHPFYQFVLFYEKYMKDEHEYKTQSFSVRLSMLAIHTLNFIFQNPSCSPSDIVEFWGEALKLPVSLMLRDLEKTTPPLIYTCRSSDVKDQYPVQPGQRKALFCTKEGRQLAVEHMRYDIEETQKTRKALLNRLHRQGIVVSEREIELFFRIIPEYTKLTIEGFPSE